MILAVKEVTGREVYRPLLDYRLPRGTEEPAHGDNKATEVLFTVYVLERFLSGLPSDYRKIGREFPFQ